jgi:hypothetical protein
MKLKKTRYKIDAKYNTKYSIFKETNNFLIALKYIKHCIPVIKRN